MYFLGKAFRKEQNRSGRTGDRKSFAVAELSTKGLDAVFEIVIGKNVLTSTQKPLHLAILFGDEFQDDVVRDGRKQIRNEVQRQIVADA